MEKINTEDKLEFWRLVVEEFENSEKSIKKQCQEKVKPLIDEFFDYIENKMIDGPMILPKSGLGKALNYTIKLKEALKTFLEDPRLEPNNGESERSLRAMTIGRKNWLFMGSKNGGDATASS